MSIGQGVPFTGADFQDFAVSSGQFSFLRSYQTRMGQDINMGTLDRSQISAFFYRFNNGFTMDYDDPGAHLLGPASSFSYFQGGFMGEFYTWNSQDIPVGAS